MSTLVNPQQSKAPQKIKRTTVGQYLLDRLWQLGVRHIFGVPGDYVLRMDKLIEQHDIQFVNTTRENTAGYMADAYSRMRGLGAACITYGVGVNITNALAQAYIESSPVVLISGTTAMEELSKGYPLHHLIHKPVAGHLETTQLDIFKQVTIDQAVLDDPKTAAESIDRVLFHCLEHQKPVYIEIPRNRVEAEIEIPLPPRFSPAASNPQTLSEALEETRAILTKCRKPVIWIGHEVQRYGIVEPLLKFAETYQIPIVTSLLGKTAISEYHPLFKGVYMGNLSRPEVVSFIEDCDCALILGLVMSDIDTGIFTARLEQEFKVVANAEEIRISHHHFKNITFKDYITGLSGIKLQNKYAAPNGSIPSKSAFLPEKGKKITTQRLFACIQSHLTKDNIVVTDVGDCLFGGADLVLDQNSFLASSYFATLGFGTPGAVGAQFAMPERRVIAIVGDGAFQMTGTELSTAIRYHLDPIVIVMNNHGYGTERPLLEGAYNDIQNWNYAALPHVLGGGAGVRATTESELDEALTAALHQRGTCTLIEVELGKTDFSDAMRRFGEHASKKT